MNSDLIATNTSDVSLPQPEYTAETLPPLLPQQAKMLEYIMEGNNYTEAYRKAGYESIEYANRAAWLLISRNPLKAHVDYFMREMAKRCTVDYKINVLNRIAEGCTNPDNVIKSGDTAIKAIDVMAKIQGHYAPQNVNVQSISTTIEDIRNAKAQYRQDK